MKSLLLMLILSLVMALNGMAQTMITKYCEVAVMAGTYSKKDHWRLGERACFLSLGAVDSLFSLRDSIYLKRLKKVDVLTTVPDVLNYMDSLGWSLVGSSHIGTSSVDFFFKKEFNTQQLNYLH